MLHALESSRTRPLPGMRERLMFLRYFQSDGIVLRAAEQAGVARSTLYRWRDQDPRFRAHWDSIAERRQDELEDRLMQIAREGERVPVFHKGVEVGSQQKNQMRATIALLAQIDRRAKRQAAAQERAEKRAAVSHAKLSHAVVSQPQVSQPPAPAPTPSPRPKPVLVSHSGGRPAARKKAAVPFVPHRLQDDWKLPLAARRPAVPLGPFRPTAAAAAAVAY